MRDTKTRIAELKEAIEKFNTARRWHRWHDPKSVAVSILIEAAELAEHFQWIQKAGVKKFPRKKWKEIEDELADVLIYCLIFANRTGIDIAEVVSRKLRRNERRFPARRWRSVKFA